MMTLNERALEYKIATLAVMVTTLAGLIAKTTDDAEVVHKADQIASLAMDVAAQAQAMARQS